MKDLIFVFKCSRGLLHPNFTSQYYGEDGHIVIDKVSQTSGSSSHSRCEAQLKYFTMLCLY